MAKSVVIYFPEEFADWEGALLIAELRQARRPMIFAGETGKPVTSIGGMEVKIERAITSIPAEEIEALVLIGSDSWPDPKNNQAVLALAKTLLERGTLVAGICAATLALARAGLMGSRKHTSNDLGFLRYFISDYPDKNYVDEIAVTDGNLITAAGSGPVDFAREVLRYLKVFPEPKLEHWYQLYKNGVKPPPDFWS